MGLRPAFLTSVLGAAILVSGCGLQPSGNIVIRTPPAPAPSHLPSPLGVNSFEINATNVFGIMSGGSVHVSCTHLGRTVKVSGSVQGALVNISLTNLRPRQQLSDPPVAGGFSDLVTMAVTQAGSPQPLRYLAGLQAGAYQGVGTITVDKTGRGGSIGINFGPPVGQNPSSETSGNTTTTGLNAGGVSGSWQCP